jgi:hypothetical protein
MENRLSWGITMTDQLNDPQKPHILVTFEHIDYLLAEALHTLAPSDSPSPLRREYADLLHIQRKVISDYISHLRGIMIRVPESRNNAIPKPQVSSVRTIAAHCALRASILEILP